jgi:hypothetical protein
VINVGALLFFMVTRRDPSSVPGMVAIMGAAVVRARCRCRQGAWTRSCTP